MGKTTRTGKSLIDIQKELGTEEQCLAFLETLRWPEGVQCVACQSKRVSKFSTKEGTRTRKNAKGEVVTVPVPARHLYQCLEKECGQQFTALAGTIFNDTHLPLEKWMLAVAIMCNAKKGVSAKQLQRDLGVSYKTAWYLEHRIREAMTLNNWTDDKLAGTVEADETYIGGKYDKRLKRARYDKPAVFGMIERETGRVVAQHILAANSWAVNNVIDESVEKGTRMMTDESKLYRRLEIKGYEHSVVIHSDKEWVRGDVHTQSIDGFWGLLKRGVIGTYHQLSIKHLDRYVQEFCNRANNRDNQDLFAITVAALALGKAMPYKKLVGPKKSRIVRNRKGANGQTPAATPSDPTEPF